MSLIHFTDGAIMMAFCVAGLLFLRYWRRTRDRLFGLFALSFFIMAVNRVFLAAMRHEPGVLEERQTVLYVIRLAAFLIILVAIVDTNRASRRGGGGGGVDADGRGHAGT